MTLGKRSLSLLLVLCLLLGLTPAYGAGEAQAATLEQLQAALTTTGAEIILTQTITISATTALDLNGCTVRTQAGVSPALRVTSGALLTLRDGGSGSILAGDTGITLEGGSLTMEGGTLSASSDSTDCRAILVKHSPDQTVSVRMEGGSVSALSGSSIPSAVYFEGSTGLLTVTGGSLSAQAAYCNTAYTVRLYNNPLTITGGEVKSSVGSLSVTKFHYALYRAEKSESPFSVTGEDIRICGMVYVRGGLNRVSSGLAGGIYAYQRPNGAYLKSGCQVEDISQDPYFWKVNGSIAASYSVSFDANGGEGEMDPIAIPEGVSMPLPMSAFVRPGFTFLGWSDTPQGGVKYGNGIAVTDLAPAGESIRLYAVWERTRYTVSWYDFQGNTLLDSYVGSEGDRPMFHGKHPVLLGGSFQGWADRPGQTQGRSLSDLPAVQGNVNYYAAFLPYVPDTLTLTWLNWEGTETLAQETLAANSQPDYKGETPTLAMTGYRTDFVGWNTYFKKSTGVPAHQLPRLTDNACYYAAFSLTPVTYTLSFHPGLYGQGTMEDQVLTYDQPQALFSHSFTPLPGYDFYRFAGWATADGGEVVYQDGQEVVNLTNLQGETIHLYAVWKLKTYLVRWHTYQGLVETVCEQSYGEAPCHPGPDPILMGGSFNGWAAAPGQTQGQPVTALPAVTQDVDYYAAFSSASPTRYTVTWLDRSGTGVYRVQSYVQNSLAQYNGPDPAQRVQGYTSTFLGWSDKPLQDQPLTDPESFRITQNLRFYAVFSLAPNQYHISFHPNGGEGSMADQEFLYDQSQALTPNSFTYLGKHFLGWATEPHGPVVYTDAQEVRNLTDQALDDIPLYAVWENDLYTVTWRDFGSYVIGEDTLLYGQKPVFVREDRQAPWRAGSDFTGWADAPFQTEGVPEEELPAVTGPVTYYAAFSSFYPDLANVFWLDYFGRQCLSEHRVGKGSPFVYPGPEPPTPDIVGAHNITFTGWASQAKRRQGQQPEELGTVTGDTTLYAAFSHEDNTYQVRFDPNGGEGVMEDQSFTYGRMEKLRPMAFTRFGYRFLGWSDKPNGFILYSDQAPVYNLTAQQGETVVLYALWKHVSYQVIWYDFWGETLLGQTTVFGDEIPSFSGQIPSVPGGEFCGWSLHPKQSEPLDPLPYPTGDMALFAAYRQGPGPRLFRTVTFMDYEGETVLETQVIPTADTPQFHGQVPPWNIRGYQTEFLGWSLAPEDDHPVEPEKGEEDITYYVSLRRVPNQYTIHFENTYPAISRFDVPDIVAHYDQPVKLPYPFIHYFNFRFLGWDPGGITDPPRYPSGSTAVNLTDRDGDSITLYLCCRFYPLLNQVDDSDDFYDGDSFSDPLAPVDTQSPEPTFPDVDPAAWYSDSVSFVAAKGLFRGNGQGFDPEGVMSRAMIAQVLYNLGGDGRGGERPFSDVDDSAWYADAVGWASSQKLILGDSGLFRPDAPVTRQELVTILYRYAQSAGHVPQAVTELTPWPDGSQVAPWAREAMAWAIGRGIVTGVGNGLLDPTGTASRAQVAAMFHRFLTS